MTKQEEIQQCLDRIKALTAEPTKVEVGKVYIINEADIVYITEDLGGNKVLGYGIGCTGTWFNLDDESWHYHSLTPVPLSKWTELLDKERVKQGLVAGAKIERPDGFTGLLRGRVDCIDLNGEGFALDEDQEAFYNGVKIYQRGIWAKVIKDEDIYVNGEKVVFREGLIDVGDLVYSARAIRFAHSLDRETLDKIVGRLKHA